MFQSLPLTSSRFLGLVYSLCYHTMLPPFGSQRTGGFRNVWITMRIVTQTEVQESLMAGEKMFRATNFLLGFPVQVLYNVFSSIVCSQECTNPMIHEGTICAWDIVSRNFNRIEWHSGLTVEFHLSDLYLIKHRHEGDSSQILDDSHHVFADLLSVIGVSDTIRVPGDC